MISTETAHARLRARLASLAGQDGAEAQRQRLRLAIRHLARSGAYPDAALLPRVSLAPWILTDDAADLTPSALEDLPLDYMIQTGGGEWASADADAQRAYLAAARVEKRRHHAGLAKAARAKAEVDFRFRVRAIGWGLTVVLAVLVSMSGARGGGLLVGLLGVALVELGLRSRGAVPTHTAGDASGAAEGAGQDDAPPS